MRHYLRCPDMASNSLCGVRRDDGDTRAWREQSPILQLCEHIPVPMYGVLGFRVAFKDHVY